MLLIGILSSIVALAGAIGLTAFFLGKVDNDRHFWSNALCLVFGASCALVVFIGMIAIKDDSYCIEYPAKNYELKFKITEFQGQIDTVYVLTPKEAKK